MRRSWQSFKVSPINTINLSCTVHGWRKDWSDKVYRSSIIDGISNGSSFKVNKPFELNKSKYADESKLNFISDWSDISLSNADKR